MNHIELFAGCGGLSLGLELAGFELVLANELSAMAAESFAYNLLGEDLEKIAKEGRKPSKSFWLSSQYTELSKRLRENPFQYPDLGVGETDIPDDIAGLKGKLVVGNIVHLNQLLEQNSKFKEALSCGFDNRGIDLVSGGPPCQSFSLAGLRRKDCDKNTLPWEFAQFVEHVEPKIAVLENVSGILRAFKEKGVRYHAWFEIAKVFASKKYIPLCIHINARLAGVPQNRPRFIMIALQEEFFENLSKTFNSAEEELFSPCINLYKKVQSKKNVRIEDYPYFEAQNSRHVSLFEKSFLRPLINKNEVSVKQAIGDIKFGNRKSKSKFVKELNKSFSNILKPRPKLQNHEARRNSELVQRRFRIYQVIQQCGKPISNEVYSVLKQQSENISTAAWKELKLYKYLYQNGEYIEFNRKSDFVKYLKGHFTKKRTQKALVSSDPAPAALSIPDDACHYDEQELRTLTVREMARIQSFPDRFVFRSKVTTGGSMRKFEVPQYTQVGNAVPPLLGLALGESIRDLLNRT